MKRVAVIGAGPAGLAALRHLLSRPHLYEPVAFEAMHDIGGQWLYADKKDVNQYGARIHSSIYKDLVINIPKDTMQYSDYPFPTDWPEYPDHRKLFQYLNNFADHHGLRKYIRLNSGVVCVKPVDGVDRGDTKWELTVRDNTRLNENENTTTEIFDAVICAVGLCSYPNIPDIPGLDTFKGWVTHSHEYRVPEPFTDKRVLMVGASYSAQDISIPVSAVAKEVVISHNKNRIQFLAPGVRQMKGVQRVTETSVVMKDGEEYHCDVIFLCTGFRTNIKFLDSECKLNFDSNHIWPLYKHTIHALYPQSFSLIGCCEHDIPFRQFECQVKFTLSAWEGVCKLPSSDEMVADQERDFQWRLSKGRPTCHAHHLSDLTESFENELAKLGKFEPYPPILYRVYDVLIETLEIWMPFKHWDYKRDENGEYDVEHLWKMVDLEKKKVDYVEPDGDANYVALSAK